MTEDRSLDEFADAGSNATESSSTDSSAGESPQGSTDDSASGHEADVATESDTEPRPVEPATATAVWTAGGAACDRCDAVVERRWHTDGARLCADCKEW